MKILIIEDADVRVKRLLNLLIADKIDFVKRAEEGLNLVNKIRIRLL